MDVALKEALKLRETLPAEIQKVLTPTIVEYITQIMFDTERSGDRVTGWEKIEKSLRGVGLSTKERHSVESVLVHPKNRGRHLVGVWESQKHGDEILFSGGWSDKKCEDATAFKVPPPPLDNDAIETNAKLVANSKGLIPPNGIKEIMSVGGSHTNVFLRMVKACIKALTKRLGGESGSLGPHLYQGRPEFQYNVEHGMIWTVIHWAVEVVWPNMPTYIQRALNIHAKGIVGEVECLLSMAQMASASGEEPDWPSIEENIRTGLPACGSYLNLLSKYLVDYSGGEDGELIQDLSAFRNAFAKPEEGQPDKILGSEFWAKLVSIRFGDDKAPLVVTAVVKSMLAAPTCIDGVVKFLSPGDVGQIGSRRKREEVMKAEKLMGDVRDICRGAWLSYEHDVRLRGLVDTRCIVLLTGKHLSLEQRKFETFDDIVKAFVLELEAVLGKIVVTEEMAKAAGWNIDRSVQKEVAVVPALKRKRMETVEEMKDIVFQTTKVGFQTGVMVASKKAANPFMIKQLDAEKQKATLVEWVFSKTPDELVVTLEELKNQWFINKGAVIQRVEGYNALLASNSWAIETVKAACLFAMRKLVAKYANDEHCDLFKHPNQARASMDLKKGELNLVLATPWVQVSRDDEEHKKSSGFAIGEFDMEDGVRYQASICGCIILPVDNKGETRKNHWIAPAWFVTQLPQAEPKVKAKEVPNMEIRFEDVEINGYMIYMPVMTNVVDVPANALLTRKHEEGLVIPPAMVVAAKVAKGKHRKR